MNIKVFWFDSGLKYKIILRRSGKVCSVLTHSDGTLIINLQFVSSYGANGVSWALVKDGSIIKAEDPATTLATEDAKPRLDTDVVPSLGIDSAATTVSPAIASMEMRSLNKNLSIVVSVKRTLVSPWDLWSKLSDRKNDDWRWDFVWTKRIGIKIFSRVMRNADANFWNL